MIHVENTKYILIWCRKIGENKYIYKRFPSYLNGMTYNRKSVSFYDTNLRVHPLYATLPIIDHWYEYIESLLMPIAPSLTHSLTFSFLSICGTHWIYIHRYSNHAINFHFWPSLPMLGSPMKLFGHILPPSMHPSHIKLLILINYYVKEIDHKMSKIIQNMWQWE